MIKCIAFKHNERSDPERYGIPGRPTTRAPHLLDSGYTSLRLQDEGPKHVPGTTDSRLGQVPVQVQMVAGRAKRKPHFS
jgi:hypothetical protein